MALSDYKISGSEINTNGVVSAPDILTGTTQENKAIFDKLPTLITNKFNALIDSLSASGAAEIGSQPFDEITAKNIQDALKQIRDLIGTHYGGEDGAGKVGYTPSEGVEKDTVQAAIEAVQANLTAYIAKIKAATGAAEVGNAPIAGMTATNVQQALEELRENIDNIVSGIIPGGSITNDMLQGPVSVEKGGTGATTPQAALADLGAGVRPNLAQNGCFDIWQRGTTFDFSGGGNNVGPDRWTNNFQKVKYERVKNTSPANCEWMLRVTNASSDGMDAGGTVLQTVEEAIANETVTISFFVQSLKNTIQLAVDNSEPTPVGTDWTFVSITKKASSQRIGIGANLGSDLSSGYNITSIKIERGNIQTNAFKTLDGNWASLPQPESDYATQLAKCQRYFRRFPANYAMGVLQSASSGKVACFRYECIPPMRTTPVLLMQNQSDLTDAIDDGTSPITPTKVVLGWRSNENVIGFYFENVSGNGGPGFVCNRYIDASAEL